MTESTSPITGKQVDDDDTDTITFDKQVDGDDDDTVTFYKQVDDDDDGTVTFDVGGWTFKTYRKTLAGHPECKLADDQFLHAHYRADTKSYFFDRDPDVFKATLNYLRTDELHLPTYVCGPAAKIELEFWGISPKKIERCCWVNYSEWNSTLDSLKRLERDRKLCTAPNVDNNTSFWKKWRPVVWRMLNRSNSSLTAKIFGLVSLFFVVLSIFSFLAETTKYFKYYPNVEPTSPTPSVSTSPTVNASNETSTISPGSTSASSEDKEEFVKHPVLFTIDLVCLVFFVLEYIVRLAFAPKKLKYVTSLFAIIDILAILTDVADFIISSYKSDIESDVVAINYLTMVRVVRILRIFRLVRHSSGLWVLLYTLRASFAELMLLVWFMVLGILLFSSLIYFIEEKDKFQSIPDGFWWALITMTTVGYGDIYPESAGGKVVGSFCAMCGVLVIGFTVPALVSNFILYYRHVEFAMRMEEAEAEAETDITSDNTETLHKTAKAVSCDNVTGTELEMKDTVVKITL